MKMASSSRVARVTVLLAGVALLVFSLAATGGGDDRAGAGPAIAPAGSSAAIIPAPSTAPELSPSVARRWARLRTVSKASRPPPGVAGGADVPTMATVPISWSGSAPAVAVPTALQRSDRAAPDRVEPVSEPPGPVVAQRPRPPATVAARDAHEMAARIRPLPGVSAAAGDLHDPAQDTGGRRHTGQRPDACRHLMSIPGGHVHPQPWPLRDDRPGRLAHGLDPVRRGAVGSLQRRRHRHRRRGTAPRDGDSGCLLIHISEPTRR